MAVELHAVLVWGFAYDKPRALPWNSSEDQVEYEDFETRLRRRAEMLGRDPDAAAGCTVGQHYDPDQPMYWLGIRDSYRSCDDVHAERVDTLEVGKDWEQRLRAACEICDVPWQEPTWCLMTLLVH